MEGIINIGRDEPKKVTLAPSYAMRPLDAHSHQGQDLQEHSPPHHSLWSRMLWSRTRHKQVLSVMEMML
uniref:Uncharacterized protein n=1 Tax=Romanomermis culicivorax TaxID=13658 RepID=A0A915KR35_ROMCU